MAVSDAAASNQTGVKDGINPGFVGDLECERRKVNFVPASKPCFTPCQDVKGNLFSAPLASLFNLSVGNGAALSLRPAGQLPRVSETNTTATVTN